MELKLDINNPILELRGITKRFPGVMANDHVDLFLYKGEVHCIIGENGAGKSTAMNILYGLIQPDTGEIFLRGNHVKFQSPREAIQAGIGMVHQEFMLVPSLTVLENIVLGSEFTKFGAILDIHKAKLTIERLLNQLGLPIPLMEQVNHLSVAMRQRVEIVKLIYRGANILILDEPTAVLTPQEVEALLNIIRMLQEQGKTIILVTHKLREVMQIADRITVMRDGKVVGSTFPQKVNEQTLVNMMVGRDALFDLDTATPEPGEIVLTITDLWVNNDRGDSAVKGLSLIVRQKEIFGIAGVAGNGQQELAEAIFGLRKVEHGSIKLSDVELTTCEPRDIRQVGAAYIPQDRLGVGSAAQSAAWKIAIMGHQWSMPVAKGSFINPRGARQYAQELFKKNEVRLVNERSKFANLSGGNKQKVIVGRELQATPRFLLAEDPTRGIDVAVSGYVRQRILEERVKGMAVLLISQDLQELLAVSDRLGVLFNGQLVKVVQRGQATETEIGLWMTRGMPDLTDSTNNIVDNIEKDVRSGTGVV